MAGSSRIMYDLRAKVNIIAEVLYRTNVCEGNSIRQLAKAAGIKPTTLDKSLQNGKISAKVECNLLRLAKFSADQVTWYDPRVQNRDKYLASHKYVGRDKAENFRLYFHELHGLSGTANRIAIPHRPAHRDENVATFTLENSGQLVEDDQPLLLFFRIVIKPGHYDNISYGFSRVMLRFVRPFSDITFGEILSGQKSVKIRDATLRARGGMFNPEWFLSIDSSVLNGEYRSNDPLCGLKNAKVGDVLTVEMAIHPHDGYLVSRQTGKPLKNTAKQAVVMALHARELTIAHPLNPRVISADDDGGWLTLGRQTITIMRGED